MKTIKSLIALLLFLPTISALAQFAAPAGTIKLNGSYLIKNLDDFIDFSSKEKRKIEDCALITKNLNDKFTGLKNTGTNPRLIRTSKNNGKLLNSFLAEYDSIRDGFIKSTENIKKIADKYGDLSDPANITDSDKIQLLLLFHDVRDHSKRFLGHTSPIYSGFMEGGELLSVNIITGRDVISPEWVAIEFHNGFPQVSLGEIEEKLGRIDLMIQVTLINWKIQK